MPNLPQQQTIVQYVTNVSQLNYTFAFYAPLPTDIQIYYQASTAVPIPASDILTLNVDYTVTYNADPLTGGFITLLFTPITGYYLTINRQVLASLNTNFANASTINGANLDAAFDRLLLLCQQNLNYNLERNLSYVINTYLPNSTPYTQLPTLPLNNVWIGSSTGVVAALLAPSPSASVLQSLLANNSPGTAGSSIVGYYDYSHSLQTTVDQFLSYSDISAVDTSMTINTIDVTLAPNYLLESGNRLTIDVASANSGAVNIVINGGAPIQVVKYDNTGTYIALTDDEISEHGFYTFIYTGSAFLLINPNPGSMAPAFFGASVYASGNQIVANGSTTVITFNTVDYDNFNIFNSITNSFLPAKAGYYEVLGIIQAVPVVTTGSAAINLYKNGTLWVPLDEKFVPGAMTLGGSFTLFLDVTDYVQLVFVNSTGGNVTLSSSGFFNNFQITSVGS